MSSLIVSPRTVEKHQLTETSRVYYVNYIRHSRAIAFLWAIFTICVAIMAIVVLLQPQWIGDTDDSPGAGYIGLYQHCDLLFSGTVLKCSGSLFNFNTLLSLSYKFSTALIMISAILCLITVIALFFFCCMMSNRIYSFCSVVQMIAAILMFIGCLIFPLGWDHHAVKQICGSGSDSYSLGKCNVRWSFILAMVLVLDLLVLSILAAILSRRRSNWPKSSLHDNSSSDVRNSTVTKRVQSPSDYY